MMLQRKILWTGFLIYATSFFLTAVGPSALPIRGYFCAAFTLVEPLQSTPLRHGGIYETRPFEYLAVIASGWVNPIFLIAAILDSTGLNRRSAKILKTLVVVMIPFSFVVFRYEHFYPREGYFLWTLGMLLTLFANELLQLAPHNALQPRSRAAEN